MPFIPANGVTVTTLSDRVRDYLHKTLFLEFNFEASISDQKVNPEYPEYSKGDIIVRQSHGEQIKVFITFSDKYLLVKTEFIVSGWFKLDVIKHLVYNCLRIQNGESWNPYGSRDYPEINELRQYVYGFHKKTYEL